MGPRDKQNKILQGLAQVLGLEAEADPVAVLKTVATTLGCTVGDDGTTVLMEDDQEGPGRSKKRRRGKAAAAAAAAEAEAEDDDEEEEEEEGGDGEEEEDGGEGEQGSEPEEEDDPEDLLQDFDLTVEPVRVEDERSGEQVAGVEGLEDGEDVFQWLISPVSAETFYEAIHDDEPLLITRPNNRTYFDGLFSKAEIDRLLGGGKLQYQFNVDVTSFSAGGGKRANFNFNGGSQPEEGCAPEMADAAVVARRFDKEGCSVRLLHPQRFCDPLWRLAARLEAYLQCPVGCNAYLTPPGTQGFAPHWDDIDAFVLQLEGSKRWRLYAPTDPEHVLPRYSSRDFEQAELGECVLDVVLEPGDFLYMPRGTVHQAESLPDSHSLHLTLSANQQRSWAVFLEEALPEALRLAAQANKDLRRTLPRDYFEFMGITHARPEDEAEEEGEEGEEGEGGGGADPRRAEFTAHCAELIEAVMHHMPLDEVADQLAVQFLQQRLPPPPAKGAAAAGAACGGEPGPDVLVALAQPGIARMVIDESGPEPIAEVHHCMANRRDLHARKPADEQEALEEALEEAAVEAAGSLEFPLGCAELLDILLGSGGAVRVGDLPPPEDGCDVAPAAVVRALLEAGVLRVVGEGEAAPGS